jgi:uncharacterized FlaG/YvyC family protein
MVDFWTIGGWVLTIIISLVGAWVAVTARVYELEKQIELLKMEMANNKEEHKAQKEQSDKQACIIEEIHSMFNRIDKSLISMSGKLNLKADKKFMP